jgi:hypothetical protein
MNPRPSWQTMVSGGACSEDCVDKTGHRAKEAATEAALRLGRPVLSRDSRLIPSAAGIATL